MKKIILIIIYTFFWRNFLRILIGLRYYNNKSLKNIKQFILIANHNSHMDTMAIMSAIPSRFIHRVHPIAARDFFGNNLFQRILMRYLVNATLIRRDREDPNRDPINDMNKMLSKKRSLILFPRVPSGNKINDLFFDNILLISSIGSLLGSSLSLLIKVALTKYLINIL